MPRHGTRQGSDRARPSLLAPLEIQRLAREPLELQVTHTLGRGHCGRRWDAGELRAWRNGYRGAAPDVAAGRFGLAVPAVACLGAAANCAAVGRLGYTSRTQWQLRKG